MQALPGQGQPVVKYHYTPVTPVPPFQPIPNNPQSPAIENYESCILESTTFARPMLGSTENPLLL